MSLRQTATVARSRRAPSVIPNSRRCFARRAESDSFVLRIKQTVEGSTAGMPDASHILVGHLGVAVVGAGAGFAIGSSSRLAPPAGRKIIPLLALTNGSRRRRRKCTQPLVVDHSPQLYLVTA